jgi:hypothetical protein
LILIDFYKNINQSIFLMNNTAHFGLTSTGTLVALGVGADTKDVAFLLADNAESVSASAGAPLNIVATLNINDLYRLKTEMTDALNALDNEALSGPAETFGTGPDYTD